MKNKLSKKTILIFVVLLAPSITVFADKYPPDNAAVLYYKAFILYKPDDVNNNMLADFVNDKISSNKQIIEFLNSGQNRKIISTITDAAQITTCDWGLNCSEGFAMQMPHLSLMRNLNRLILADAKLLAEKGNYRDALSICITAKRMACHSDGGMIISHLVYIAANVAANKTIQDILNSKIDAATLKWFEGRIEDIQKLQPAAKNALIREFEIARHIKRERISQDISNESADSDLLQKLNGIMDSESLFEENINYWGQIVRLYADAFDLPYLQADSRIKELGNKLQQQSKEDERAVIAALLMPAISKIHSVSTRNQSNENALRVAVDIYIKYAQDAKLPDTLPPGCPKDVFSGKDFEYEKTKDGFLLKCNENNLPEEVKKDIDKYEYKFKLK
jgi:hypothetical protein